MRTALIVRKSCPAIGRLTEKRRPAPGKRAGLVLFFAGMFEPPRGLAVPLCAGSESFCRSGYFGGCICIGQVCPGLRHMAESPRSFRFGEKRLPSRLPKEQKSRLRLRRAAICFCQSLRYRCTISLPRNRRRSHYCRRPPAIVLRQLPFRLLPLRIGPLRSGPCWAFCWALYISCEAACHALLSSVVALSMSARF